ncbi:hypothetical protein GCM10022244_12540 [Streptomyces gulbargensis]|uniref:Uncharacterized protein n=1 Tax=Streptomyces gulbargensis TaxID=364901 RepID=A0ABP7LMA5_9ACTN
MTSLADALALYDMASQIDRLWFRLRALAPGSTTSPLAAVTATVHALAGINVAVSDEIRRRLNGDLHAAEKKAIEAYSAALAPLGEAMTELGRLQAGIAFYNFTTHPMHRRNPSVLEGHRQHVAELTTECCEAADEILEATVGELQSAAIALAPSPARAQPAITPSPHIPSRPGQTHAAPAVPPSTALPAVAPHAAKVR